MLFTHVYSSMTHNSQEKEAQSVCQQRNESTKRVHIHTDTRTTSSPACPPPLTQSHQATFLPLRADPEAPLSAKPEPWPVNP